MSGRNRYRERRAWRRAIRRCPHLTANAKVVGCALSEYTDKQTLEAFPSRITLARDADVSEKTVTRAVNALERLGFLFVKRRGLGRSNLYRLIPVPEERDEPVERSSHKGANAAAPVHERNDEPKEGRIGSERNAYRHFRYLIARELGIHPNKVEEAVGQTLLDAHKECCSGVLSFEDAVARCRNATGPF